MNDSDHLRLLKLKEADGFKDRTWEEWLHFKGIGVPLNDTVDEAINRTTGTMLPLWLMNFSRNLTFHLAAHEKGLLEQLKSLPLENMHDARELVPKDMVDVPLENTLPKTSCIIIGRGPSVWKHKHLETLAKSNYKGIIYSCDGMLVDCLRAGVTPDKFPNFLVQSVDGNRRLIVKWYGDENFDENNPDATEDEKRVNAENVELVNKYGPKLKVVLSSTVANNVLTRCLRAKAHVYLIHPLFDAIGMESLTRVMMYTTQTTDTPPLLTSQSLGNAGGTAYVLSWNVLRASPICLVGLDFGYELDTPIEQTAYASRMLKELGDLEGASRSMMEVLNPYDGRTYKTDHVFAHYKKAFIETLEETPPPKWLRIINATQGGTLFGHERIEWMTFAQALEELAK